MEVGSKGTPLVLRKKGVQWDIGRASWVRHGLVHIRPTRRGHPSPCSNGRSGQDPAKVSSILFGTSSAEPPRLVTTLERDVLLATSVAMARAVAETTIGQRCNLNSEFWEAN